METEHRGGQKEGAENESEVVNSGSEVTGNTRGVTSDTASEEQDSKKGLTDKKSTQKLLCVVFSFLQYFLHSQGLPLNLWLC